MGILSSALKIGESAGSTALRTLNAQLFPKSATKVRQGQAVNDIIGLNAKTPNRYAKPPFPSRKGSPLPPLAGDPRAAVTGAARREELIQKRKALAKKKSSVKGSVTKPKKANKNALDRILNTAQPGSDEWLGAFQDRYPGM